MYIIIHTYFGLDETKIGTDCKLYFVIITSTSILDQLYLFSHSLFLK